MVLFRFSLFFLILCAVKITFGLLFPLVFPRGELVSIFKLNILF